MTNQQAADIQDHLIKELNRYGFGDLIQDSLLFLEEKLPENERVTPSDFLLQFLQEIIESIENISNENYQGLLARFNRLLSPNSMRVQTLSVELTGTEGEAFDLSNLPSYAPLIEELRNIREFLSTFDNNN
jgi:hypothetical protein